LALALFGLAAWLMSHGEKGGASAEQKEPRPFPGRLDGEGWQRVQRRLTLPAPAASNAPDPLTGPQMRDPLLTALRPDAKINLVFEASAIRDSPVGQLLLRCMSRDAAGRKNGESRLMLDVLQQADRVAISDNTLLATGPFDPARWPQVNPGKSSAYGEATLYESEEGQGGSVLATRAPNLVLLAQNRAAVEKALDRLDDPDPDAKPPIAPSETYGEIYGVLASDELTRMLPVEFRDKFAGATNRIELHADTRDDVLIVADVGGPQAAQVEELGRALAGAMALGRVKARADSDAALQQLLERSRVALNGASFRVVAAFPIALIADRLGECAAVDSAVP
jgi:hypothetical protein